MMNSKKVLGVSFLAMSFLVGCGDSEPSDSDIIKQLSSQISPCPELSITDFQKINGYPQNDGSYVDQVQYNLVFSPPAEMLNYVADFDNKKNAINSEGAADNAKGKALNAQAKSMGDACIAAYQSAIHSYNAELDVTLQNGYPLVSDTEYESSLDDSPDANAQSQNANHIAYLMVKAPPMLQQAQQNLAALENAQGPTVPATTQYVAQLTSYLKLLNTIKPHLDDTVNQLSACQRNVQALYQNNQGVFDHLKALNAEMASANSDDLNSLQNEMNKDCPIIVIGGVLGLFNADKYNIEAYGQTYKLAESGTFHLVKSDNGWVIQN